MSPVFAVVRQPFVDRLMRYVTVWVVRKLLALMARNLLGALFLSQSMTHRFVKFRLIQLAFKRTIPTTLLC